jgi:hypothetical protein
MQADTPSPALQPLLHDAVVTLRAPTQAWSRFDGSMGAGAIDGIFVSDLRVLRGLDVTFDGHRGEHIATLEDAADHARFECLLRGFDGPGADPDVRATLARTVTADGVRHSVTVTSRRPSPVSMSLRVALVPALDDVQRVKAGLAGGDPEVLIDGEAARWPRPELH